MKISFAQQSIFATPSATCIM